MKDVTAKIVDLPNGELAVYAVRGADVRIHMTVEQMESLIPKMVEHVARKRAA